MKNMTGGCQAFGGGADAPAGGLRPAGAAGSYLGVASEEAPEFRWPGTKGSGAGPSGPDCGRAESVNNGAGGIPVPHYVMDPDNVLVIPSGNLSRAARVAGTRSIPRKQGSCQII
jgi:hypothetical protein